jgi:hypothetical protein
MPWSTPENAADELASDKSCRLSVVTSVQPTFILALMSGFYAMEYTRDNAAEEREAHTRLVGCLLCIVFRWPLS